MATARVRHGAHGRRRPTTRTAAAVDLAEWLVAPRHAVPRGAPPWWRRSCATSLDAGTPAARAGRGADPDLGPEAAAPPRPGRRGDAADHAGRRGARARWPSSASALAAAPRARPTARCELALPRLPRRGVTRAADLERRRPPTVAGAGCSAPTCVRCGDARRARLGRGGGLRRRGRPPRATPPGGPARRNAHDVRAARAPVRLLQLRHPLTARTSCAVRRARPRRSSLRARRGGRAASTRCESPARPGRPEGHGLDGPAKLLPGPRASSRAHGRRGPARRPPARRAPGRRRAPRPTPRRSARRARGSGSPRQVDRPWRFRVVAGRRARPGRARRCREAGGPLRLTHLGGRAARVHPSADAAVGPTEGTRRVGPSGPARPRVAWHLRLRARARPLLENGRARAKSQCGRLDGVCRHRARTVKTTTVALPASVGRAADRRQSQSGRLSDFSGARLVRRGLDGEFDPGSGRTLAACLTHASRTRFNRWQHW